MPTQFASRLILALGLIAGAGSALAADPVAEPYGTAKFKTYDDIDSLKTLKVVWDFNFADPKSVAVVFNNLAALLKATADYGPRDFDPVKVVIVSHGPEVVLWAKQNYAKYKDIVDRAAAFAQQGVKFEICRNDAAALGFKPEDLDGFVSVIPARPYALTYWQNKGYALMAVGATVPTKPITPFNKDDVKAK